MVLNGACWETFEALCVGVGILVMLPPHYLHVMCLEWVGLIHHTEV